MRTFILFFIGSCVQTWQQIGRMLDIGLTCFGEVL